jgi:DNA-binding MarR family transcriptional regulator
MDQQHYQALAQFRYQIRLFLHFSEKAAREAGLEPQQHQLLLTVRGFASVDEKDSDGPTVGYLAERLQIRHNTAVELIDRMEERRLIRRRHGDIDRRQVVIELMKPGERLLEKLSEEHTAEISQTGPALVKALESVISTAGVRA